MQTPLSLDAAVSELWTKSQGLFVAAEHAIPVSGHDVVDDPGSK